MDVFQIAFVLGEMLDLVGVAIIVIGILLASAVFIKDFFAFKTIAGHDIYKKYRANLGRAILIGLEVLVGGDIIRSVVGQPDFSTVGLLAIIVLIRTFLSITFDMEVENKWPWQKK